MNEASAPFGDHDEAEAVVGKGIGCFQGADAVSRGDIRRRLETLAWDCPLHYDDATAQAHGYREAIAPVTMYLTWALEPYWKPGDPRPHNASAPLMPHLPLVSGIPGSWSSMVEVEVDVEFRATVYPGDRISACSAVTSVVRKRTSIGEGAFITVETTYRKQTGEVAAIDRLTIFRYHPHGTRQ